MRYAATIVSMMLAASCGDDTDGASSASSGGSTTATSATSATTTPASSSNTDSGPGTTAGTGGTATGTSSASATGTTGATTGDPGDDLIGWAGEEGDGLPTTTGGQGGQTVVVTTAQEFEQYATSPDPVIIQVSGTIVGVFDVGSNKTIEGADDGTIEGGLLLDGPDGDFVSNVIIRNLTVRGVNCPGEGCTNTDAITVYRAHHVWIDHCDISDGDDGNLDITEESDYVTVSWNRFSYSNSSGIHRLSNLIGASDAATDDADDLRVTLHHNWWTANVAERMPRVRFGPVHVFNNYYTAADDLYCIRAGFEADILAENNYFEGVKTPFDNIDPTANLVGSGNIHTPGPIAEPNQGPAFTPPYTYVLDPAADVPAIVMAGVGPST
jgi:pectate lyase